MAKNKANASTTLTTAAADSKAKQDIVLTPSQTIGTFCENLPKDVSKSLKGLYGDLLAEFAQESQSRIEIGSTLVKIRELLGENFGKFLQTQVVEVLRKSSATCYNYIALSQAASLKFARNKVAATAVFRIWGAEGCFDTVNGELKSVVDEAIKAVGGIPESTDSTYCEQWARQFVNMVDKLIRGTRKAQTGGKKWDAATINEKHGKAVKAVRAFLQNDGVNGIMAINLLSAILFEAMVEMSQADLKDAITSAQTKYKARVKEISTSESPAATPTQPAAAA